MAEFCIVNRRHCFKTQAHLRNTHLFLNIERSQKTNLYSISLWDYFFLHYSKLKSGKSKLLIKLLSHLSITVKYAEYGGKGIMSLNLSRMYSGVLFQSTHF